MHFDMRAKFFICQKLSQVCGQLKCYVTRSRVLNDCCQRMAAQYDIKYDSILAKPMVSILPAVAAVVWD
jgi:hypothetical protein